MATELWTNKIRVIKPKERKKLCAEMGLYYDGLIEHGDAILLMDRVILLKEQLAKAEG